MKKLVACALACTLGVTSFASSQVPVTMRQNWPWDGKMIIDVTMPTGTNDLALTAKFYHGGAYVETDIETAGGVSGEFFCCEGGTHRIVWDPAAAGYTNRIEGLEVSATAIPPEDRTWLVVNPANGSFEYFAEDAAPVDGKGWPWQADTYKCEKMVFRRIPAGKYTVGYTTDEVNFLKNTISPGYNGSFMAAREVEITSDYYISIYQMTRGHYYHVLDPASTETGKTPFQYNGGPGKVDHAAGATCFLRGSNAVDNISWPTTKFRVKEGTCVDMFRKRWNNRFKFDLPTVAQWQIAARPDSQWLWYDTPNYGGGKVGDSFETLSNVVETICQAWFVLRRNTNQWGAPDVVGMYQPNSFGVYDLVASRPDVTLNQYRVVDMTSTAAETDPVGSDTNPASRIMLGHFAYGGKLAQWGMAVWHNRPTDSNTTEASGNLNEMRCTRLVIHLRPPRSFGGKWE